MTTHEQLECKIAKLHEKMFALQKEIEGVESELVKVKDADEWPQDKATYYGIDAYGSVAQYFNISHETTENMKRIGNCFRSEQDALFAVERLKVLAEMRKFAFEPDWKDTKQQKYMLQYSYLSGLSIDFETYCCDFYGPWFRTTEDAQDCIDTIGEERLKKYYFGVKEDE